MSKKRVSITRNGILVTTTKEKRFVVPVHFGVGNRYNWYTKDEYGMPYRCRDYNTGLLLPSQGVTRPNMMNDQGFDQMVDNSFLRTTYTYGGDGEPLRHKLYISDGTTDPKPQSNGSEASQSGTTVTLDVTTGDISDFTASVSAGDVFYFADGTGGYVSTVDTSTTLTLDRSQTVSQQEFEIHKVDRTALANTAHADDSQTAGGFVAVTSATDEGTYWLWSSLIGRTITLTANRNVSEWGLTYRNGLSTEIGFQDLVRDANGDPITIAIPDTKQFEVRHTIEVYVQEAVSTGETFDIDDLDINGGFESATTITCDVAPYVVSGGVSEMFQIHDPSSEFGSGNGQGQKAYIMTSAQTPASTTVMPTATAHSANDTVIDKASYSAGTFNTTGLNRYATLGAADFNQAIYGFRFNPYFSSSEHPDGGLGIYFTSPTSFTKEDTRELTVGYNLTWDRYFA